MLQQLLEPLLARAGDRLLDPEPRRIERLVVHGAYVLGNALTVLTWLRYAGVAAPFDVGSLCTGLTLLAGASYLLLFWAKGHRAVPPAPWFASHLVWLAGTFSLLLLVVLGGMMLFVFCLLFALVAPPLAFAAVHGPVVLAFLAALWFTYRCCRGYLTYLCGNPVGCMEAATWSPRQHSAMAGRMRVHDDGEAPFVRH